MPNVFRAIILLWLNAIAGFAYAVVEQDGKEGSPLPAVFHRIEDIAEMQGKSYCLIGAENPDTKQFYLLSDIPYPKAGKSMTGYLHRAGAEAAFSCSTPEVVWQATFDSATGNLTLRPYRDGGKCLARAKETEAGLLLASAATPAAHWRVEAAEGGTFTLSPPANAKRHLGVRMTGNYGGGMMPVFGNYDEGGDAGFRLCVYKKEWNAADEDGESLSPAEGMTVALVCGTRAFSARAKSVALDGRQLCDDTLAPGDGLTAWVAGLRGDGSFHLKNPETGTYLGYDLAPTPESLPWRVTNGHLATCEDRPRVPVYTSGTDSWQTAAPAHRPQGAKEAALRQVRGAARQETTDEGLRTLYGGWTADALAGLPLDGVTGLDLTHIALPMGAADFTNLPPKANLPVYVALSMGSHAPKSWPFVVLCGKGGNTLRDGVAVADKTPFATDRAITVAQGQMTYRREFPEDAPPCWQTLCLPFNAPLPQGCTAVEVTGTADGALQAAPAQSIAAGKAYLIRRSDAQAPSAFTFSAESGSVSATLREGKPAGRPLQGTFVTQTVTPDDTAVYLLRSTQGAFAHAAPGSKTAPFRAALRLPAAEAKTLVLKTPTLKEKGKDTP